MERQREKKERGGEEGRKEREGKEGEEGIRKGWRWKKKGRR